LGHKLLEDTGVSEKIRGAFGMNVLDRELKVDREKLSRLVFGDEKLLKKLNEIVHPKLKDELDSAITRAKGDIIIDLALFDELDVTGKVDKIILVQADVTNIYERLSPKYSKREILNVMNNQNVVKDADYVLENDGTIEDLHRKVEQLLNKIK